MKAGILREEADEERRQRKLENMRELDRQQELRKQLEEQNKIS